VSQVIVQETPVHAAGDPPVVEHHIESAETVSGSLYDAADVLDDRDINVPKPSPRPAVAGKLVTVVVVEIRDDHFGPGIHESFDYSTTEARGTAGGDGDFSGQRGGHRLSRSDRAASGDTGGEDAVAEAATGPARRVK